MFHFGSDFKMCPMRPFRPLQKKEMKKKEKKKKKKTLFFEDLSCPKAPFIFHLSFLLRCVHERHIHLSSFYFFFSFEIVRSVVVHHTGHLFCMFTPFNIFLNCQRKQNKRKRKKAPQLSHSPLTLRFPPLMLKKQKMLENGGCTTVST